MKSNPNEEFVDAWLAARTRSSSPRHVADLLLKALGALRERSKASLGDVTLDAILDRVVDTARQKYPFLTTIDLRVDASSVVDTRVALSRSASADDLALATRLILVEALAVLGRLTGDVLTTSLYAALDGIGYDGEPRARSAYRSGEPS